MDANSSTTEDILPPLLTTSIITDKDDVPVADKTRRTSVTKREVTKLGLFTLMGLTIVSFQVKLILTDSYKNVYLTTT